MTVVGLVALSVFVAGSALVSAGRTSVGATVDCVSPAGFGVGLVGCVVAEVVVCAVCSANDCTKCAIFSRPCWAGSLVGWDDVYGLVVCTGVRGRGGNMPGPAGLGGCAEGNVCGTCTDRSWSGRYVVPCVGKCKIGGLYWDGCPLAKMVAGLWYIGLGGENIMCGENG